MNMTWAEFVAAVERELIEKNISRDTELWYIDTHPGWDELKVVVDDTMGLTIT